tara:strand:+ start:2722 stop:3018 length:297 start_codon:yes stop_codon:yes gene_type:complete
MIWVLLVISICISAYFGYRAYYLAGTISDAQEYIEELEVVNVFMYTNIKTAYDNMKIIDHKGAFESEDEAGTTFSLLLETIETLKEQFDDEETKSEEK